MSNSVVVYKIDISKRVSSEQFPNLNRWFKTEIVERCGDNPHLDLTKWRMNNNDENVVYVIGKV